MAKPPKAKEPTGQLQSHYLGKPWQCRHNKTESKISAHVEVSKKWETILTVHATSGASAETMTNFILRLVNNHQQNQNLLRAAMEALESVMQDGVNFSTEQAAEHVAKDIKRTIIE